MEAYQNKSGISGVVAYELGSDFIKVTFEQNDCVYLYNYKRPGEEHVEEMKKRATSGLGLATYIGKYVKQNYFSKQC